MGSRIDIGTRGRNSTTIGGSAGTPKFVGARAEVIRIPNVGVKIRLTDYKGTTEEVVAEAIESIVSNDNGSLTFTLPGGRTFTTDSLTGPKGDQGIPGVDGFDPVIEVTEIEGGHEVSITDAVGTQTFDVMDGESAEAQLTDVTINGTSIVQNKVANIPIASYTDYGVVKTELQGESSDGYSHIALLTEHLGSTIKHKLANVNLATTSERGLMSKYDKAKLNGIETGAEANVQSDWNESDSTKDAFIKNKPTIPVVPTNVSAFTNDAGYLTTETDPTVPSWAKASTKPAYTAEEVGALPDDTEIPSKVSDLENDSRFIKAVDTASGAIATFKDAFIKKLTAEINPIQDLHGYDKPWAGGNGKNLLPQRSASVTKNGITVTPNSDGSVTISGANTSSGTTVIMFSEDTASSNRLYLPTGSYNISANNFKADCWVGVYKNNDGSGNWSATSFGPLTFTVEDGDYVFPAIRIVGSASFSTPATVYPMIRKSTDSDTWEPYSNICPISGWAECDLSRTGKNFLYVKPDITNQSVSGVSAKTNADGSITLSGTASNHTIVISNLGAGKTATDSSQNDGKKWIPNGTYYVSLESTKASLQILGCNQPAATSGIEVLFNSNTGIVTIDDSYAYNWVRIYVANGTNVDGVTLKPIICLNSETDKTWEPNHNNTYTISLGGTRYGGTIDVTSGMMNVCPYYASYNGETLTGEWISDRDEYIPNTSPTIGAQVVNIGGTTTSVQLTPTQIEALVGENNVWASTGEVELELVGVPEMADKIPFAPTSDGTYTLKVTITDGEAAYSWVADA